MKYVAIRVNLRQNHCTQVCSLHHVLAIMGNKKAYFDLV